MIEMPEIGPFVYCAYADRLGFDPIKHTKVWGGVAFCSACGATDHPVQ